VKKIALVRPVHYDEAIEAGEISRHNLPRDTWQVHAADRCNLARPTIGWFAGVPAAGARGVHFEEIRHATRAREMQKDALSDWAATDVSHADEEDAR